ncbi:MAG: hypothetical protein J6A83_02655 [Clostridia bacterium]|nr:hypothetical protein [Clostridia bacterium]
MSKLWTPAERAITALTLGQPDEVPTFELEFQLGEEMFGYNVHEENNFPKDYRSLSAKELEKAAYDLADQYARIYGDKTAYDIGGAAISGDPVRDSKPGLDYAIVPVYNPEWRDPNSPITVAFRKRLREHFGNTRLFAAHGDGTFGIPNGSDMYEFSYRIADDPEGLLEEAALMAEKACESNKRQREAGLDLVLLCRDYCYNSGPFLSPAMFDEFITPFLAKICSSAKNDGLYVIKHTDGNIMPIIRSLVEAGPHALHSLDPMAGVDIREVKRFYGDKVALCGNVHCAAMQTGTVEQVIESAEYCLNYGKEGGGYIFTTSNVPFKGIPAERYQLVHDIWLRMKKY